CLRQPYLSSEHDLAAVVVVTTANGIETGHLGCEWKCLKAVRWCVSNIGPDTRSIMSEPFGVERRLKQSEERHGIRCKYYRCIGVDDPLRHKCDGIDIGMAGADQDSFEFANGAVQFRPLVCVYPPFLRQGFAQHKLIPLILSGSFWLHSLLDDSE